MIHFRVALLDPHAFDTGDGFESLPDEGFAIRAAHAADGELLSQQRLSTVIHCLDRGCVRRLAAGAAREHSKLADSRHWRSQQCYSVLSPTEPGR